MGVHLTGDLGKYLRIPLLHQRATNAIFAPMLTKTQRRLSTWKRKLLNLAGRTVLVKSVITSIPAYHMQTMLIPKGIIKRIEQQSRSFIWGDKTEQRRIHLISWDQVSRDKKEGGLGIKNLRKQNEAYMMKLCWKLLTDSEALWVQVLKAKYGCETIVNLDLPSKQHSSGTWKGICEVWNSFKKGLVKKICKGRRMSFWFEKLSETKSLLIDMVPGWEGLINRNECVYDYVTPSGDWNIEKLLTWFPRETVAKIMCAYPPREERGEDKFIWMPSTDGSFTIKSAYSFLIAGTPQEADTIWKMLWKWRIPEKIKSFMWLFTHNRVHTAALRKRRGLQDDATCPFGCEQEEEVMHLIRDCANATERWRSILAPHHWEQFFSLSGIEWIKWNLNKEVGRDHTKKISWSTLFGYVCWDIWTSRCNKLYDAEHTQITRDAKESFYRACWDKDLIDNCNFYGKNLMQELREPSLPEDYVELAVDGSVLTNGSSGCGGVIKATDGQWISGFCCKLSSVPPAVAELIGFWNGLCLCLGQGF